MATHLEKAVRALEVARGPMDSNQTAYLQGIYVASLAQAEAQLAILEKLEEIAQALKSR